MRTLIWWRKRHWIFSERIETRLAISGGGPAENCAIRKSEVVNVGVAANETELHMINAPLASSLYPTSEMKYEFSGGIEKVLDASATGETYPGIVVHPGPGYRRPLVGLLSSSLTCLVAESKRKDE